jgi:hypothetical protein
MLAILRDELQAGWSSCDIDVIFEVNKRILHCDDCEMLQISIDSVMNCLTTERGLSDNAFRLAIFLFRLSDFVQVKYQIRNKATNCFFQAP